MATRLFGLRTVRLLVTGVLGTFLLVVFSGVLPLYPEPKPCNCPELDKHNEEIDSHPDGKQSVKESSHSLCVLVPFRDRFEELLEFAPYLHNYLTKQGKEHCIIIINQLDRYRFNRASLINAGFLETRSKCDYIAMHDVDLLPQNEELRYDFPEKGPYHLASPHLHPLYHYKTYVGGILLLQSKHFEMLNGLSNKYWGWGKEDDEFFVRMKKAKLKLSRPGNMTSGYKSFRHIHDRRKRPRDNQRFFDQYEQTRRLDKVTGLSTVSYTVDSETHLVINGAPVIVLNIFLDCDLNFTPWCLKAEDHEKYKLEKGPIQPKDSLVDPTAPTVKKPGV